MIRDKKKSNILGRIFLHKYEWCVVELDEKEEVADLWQNQGGARWCSTKGICADGGAEWLMVMVVASGWFMWWRCSHHCGKRNKEKKWGREQLRSRERGSELIREREESVDLVFRRGFGCYL
jgi:hypothetical protein